jgi:hypothetical protein
MRFTLREMEQRQWEKDAADYAVLPAELKTEPLHYWHVERRARRKKNSKTNWIFVRELFVTKNDAAMIFLKHYGKGYRLRHIYVYR